MRALEYIASAVATGLVCAGAGATYGFFVKVDIKFAALVFAITGVALDLFANIVKDLAGVKNPPKRQFDHAVLLSIGIASMVGEIAVYRQTNLIARTGTIVLLAIYTLANIKYLAALASLSHHSSDKISVIKS